MSHYRLASPAARRAALVSLALIIAAPITGLSACSDSGGAVADEADSATDAGSEGDDVSSSAPDAGGEPDAAPEADASAAPDGAAATDAGPGPQPDVTIDAGGEPASDATDASGSGIPPELGGPGLGVDYEGAGGPLPRYEPGAEDWTAVGWPTDRLRDAETGAIDLSGFPNPGIDLLDTYLAHGMETLDGWGLNSAIYIQLDAAPALDSLPTAAEAMQPDATVQLVNVTPGSPAWAARSPLVFEWYEDGFDPYWPDGTLAMRPVFGFPLREGETYCAVLTRAVTGEGGEHLQVPDAFTADLGVEPSLDPLLLWLEDGAPLINLGDIATATCFTTQTATGELRAVADWLDTQTPPEVATVSEPVVWGELHGTYIAPNFQAGDKPYDEVGGDLQFDAEGAPIAQADEELRFMLRVPTDAPMPDAGWPVVLYAHGTGGDYESCRGVTAELEGYGFAVLCIDQPLHGSRGEDGGYSDDELVAYSFNFLNPLAGRMSFRQSAIDTLTLSRMVAAGSFTFSAMDTIAGVEVALDPDRIWFFGHSHGGLSGALVLGVDKHIQGGVLSGAAGVLIETILRRKDPLDLAVLVSSVLGTDLSVLDTFHPMLSVVQTLVDATDPINYARFWLEPGPGGLAKHVFVTEGTEDHASPSVGTDAMAAAAGLPLLLPLAKVSDAHELLGMAPLDAPVALNLGDAEAPRTGALGQWQGGSHWVAFYNDEARAMWNTFFRTIGEGVAPQIGVADAVLVSPGVVSGGESCEAVGALAGDALPVTVTGDTSAASADHSTGGGCGGGDAGAGRRDLVYSFMAPEAGDYRFRLDLPASPDPDEPRPGPDLLYLATECGDVAGTCLAQHGNQIDRAMAAGELVYVFVDGNALGDKGAFYLKVSQLCAELSCDDRECGAWGCGSCGACDDGASCVDGQCLTPTWPGDTCADPLPVGPLPFVGSGDTTPYLPTWGYSGGQCPGESSGYGGASSDVVYSFTAPSTDRYVFELDTSFDSNLWVAADCDDPAASCLSADKRSGGEHLQLDLEGGQEVFVIVDGASNSVDRQGPYTLRVHACVPDCEDKPCGGDGCGGECGACDGLAVCLQDSLCEPIPYICDATAECEPLAQGDVCADPFVVDALPFTGAGSTNAYYADYGYGGGDCPGESTAYGGGSKDVAYLFTPEATALYDIKVNTNYDSNLYVVGDCQDIGGSCVAAKEDKGKSKNEALLLELVGGEPVYVIVDGRNNSGNDSGTYTLTIDTCVASCEGKVCGSDGCGGSCGACGGLETCSGGACVPKTGYQCDNARVVNKIPYEHSGNTNDFAPSYADACQDGAGAASSDVAYRFTPSFATTWTVTLSASWDAQVYILTDCADGGSCVAASGGAGSFEVELAEDVAHYLIVDGLPADEAVGGSYTLKVAQTCFPDCTDKDCGGDGCGGSCGTCSYPADLCGDGQCHAPEAIVGNTCAAPFLVDSLPFLVEASTEDGALNHYSLPDGACEGVVSKGLGSTDHVYLLEAPADGTYTVTVWPDGWDAVLYAVDDCVDLAGTCRGASDGQTVELVTLELVAGEVVLLVVDGAAHVDDDAGDYVLSVDGP